MNTISYMTANFVARQVGYHMTEGWMQGDGATQAHFKPIETFAPRFEEYVQEVQRCGYSAIDLWLAILHPDWATEAHINAANAVLSRYQMPVVSLAGWFGGTPAEFEANCKLAKAFNCTILGGNTGLLQSDRPALIGLLKQYELKLGFENHPEKTPEEALAKIGTDSGGVIGTALDTGWYGTNGYDAADAIYALRDHLVHVHLKDVKEPGGHETCRFGAGCVPVQRCVEVLKQIGYSGPISVEHEPEHFDPAEDMIANLAYLKEWLTA
jgi:sugar phosphate isomerase/epimerase